MLAKAQDEGGHDLCCAAETPGVSRDELTRNLMSGKTKYSSIFNYPALTRADMDAGGWLVNEAAIINQAPLQRTSGSTCARAMVQI